ncbi:MAG: lasso peptide biosynthesis B2 protein [Deltaproteobacteria bacterium]
MALYAMPSGARTALRFLAPGTSGPASRLRRALLVALMPRLVRRHHVVELLEMLDGDGTAGADARKVVDGLRRRPTTCLYRSLAGFASLRGAGEPVRFVIGVRVDDGEVVAHAWLERNGEPVGEPTDPRDRFAVAFVYPPQGGGRTRMEGGMAESLSSKDVILTEMKDGTGVLLDLKSKFYFTLNATGVVVWKLLASGEAKTARELAERIAKDFEAPSMEEVEKDVGLLMKELEAEGLIGGPPR